MFYMFIYKNVYICVCMHEYVVGVYVIKLSVNILFLKKIEALWQNVSI